MNSPMKDRRDALDLAISTLDEKRRQYSWGMKIDKTDYPGSAAEEARKQIDKINKAIKILTGMKDEGPLL